MEVIARLKDGFDDLKEPGDFILTSRLNKEGTFGMLFKCPCGCGDYSGINFDKERSGPAWNWDGNREKPTVTPSIRRIDKCQWHGFLTNGIFKSC